MVNLNSLQNAVLSNLQLSELVNQTDFTQPPLWATATLPAISQVYLTYNINRAYQRTLLGLSDCEIDLAYITFPSVATSSDYALPPGNTVANPVTNIYNPSQTIPTIDLSAFPLVQRVSRVLYTPNGQPWTLAMEGGIRLISWRAFLGHAAFNYLRPFTYNIIPDYAAVTPNRKILSFFPGTASANDTITVEYVPMLTAGTPWPPLAAGTDSPIVPDEANQMLEYWATALCWPKLREFGAKKEYEQMFYGEERRVRELLGPRSRGDTFRIQSANQGLVESYPIGGGAWLIGGEG